jgi:hypothetical protein
LKAKLAERDIAEEEGEWGAVKESKKKQEK